MDGASVSFTSFFSENSDNENGITSIRVNHRSSWKWNCFEEKEDKIQCRSCKYIFSLKTSHSILKKHYMKHDLNTVQKILKVGKSKPHNEVQKLLMEFIIHGSHSLRIVEEEAFVKLLSGLNPEYKLPSRYTIHQTIQNTFKEEKNRIIKHFRELSHKVSLTFDFWTSVTSKPYMVITSHFTMNGTMQSLL